VHVAVGHGYWARWITVCLMGCLGALGVPCKAGWEACLVRDAVGTESACWWVMEITECLGLAGGFCAGEWVLVCGLPREGDGSVDAGQRQVSRCGG
jgi:hypothetical protein